VLDELFQRVLGTRMNVFIWSGPAVMEVSKVWLDDNGVWIQLRSPAAPPYKHFRLKVALTRVGSEFTAVQLVPPSSSNEELMSQVCDMFRKALRNWTEEVLLDEPASKK
jgi:hypothetical protein